LAWAAGLFEGEGTIRINSVTVRNMGFLMCSVVNTDREVVEFFSARWPGYFRNATGLDPRRQKPAWVWAIAARKARAFLLDIQPYLVTDRVRFKAELGLAFQDQKEPSNSIRWAPDEVKADYFDRQRDFFGLMRKLNRRGAVVHE
jgi:hypothetical protein